MKETNEMGYAWGIYLPQLIDLEDNKFKSLNNSSKSAYMGLKQTTKFVVDLKQEELM